MHVLEFVKELAEQGESKLTADDREKIVEGLKDIYDNHCKEDPLLAEIFSTVQKAVATKNEISLSFTTQMWSNSMTHISVAKVGGSILSDLLGKIAIDCADEKDVMILWNKCKECDDKDDCSRYEVVREKALGNNGKDIN